MIKKNIPDIFIKQFNHKKNKFSINELLLTDTRKVWWICEKKHEWYVAPISRLRSGKKFLNSKKKFSDCRICSLIDAHKIPENVNKFFNQSLNPTIKLQELSQTSKVKIKWQCPKNPKHIWLAQYNSRALGINKNRSCPFCAGLKPDPEQTLEKLYPKIYKSIIKTNNNIDYSIISPGSGKVFDFKCPNGSDHFYKSSVFVQTRHSKKTDKKNILKNDKLRCPFCLKYKLSKTNSLEITHPELAKIFDTKKNKISPDKIIFNSTKYFWWLCSSNKEHSFRSQSANVIRSLKSKYKGCAVCAKKYFNFIDSLYNKRPDLVTEIDNIRNKNFDPKKIPYYSTKSIYWICSKDKTHKWKYEIGLRAKKKKLICPYCSKYKFHESNSLYKVSPEVSKEWHYQLNGKKNPKNIKSTSEEIFYWKCRNNSTHIWQDSPSRRVNLNAGCPLCSKNFKWNIFTLKAFLHSIKDHVDNLTPAEKFLIFQQTGNPDRRSSNLNFIKNFASGRFPKEEMEKFLNNERSLVDEFIENDQLKIDKLDNENINNNLSNDQNSILNNTLLDTSKDENNLPIVATSDVLKTLSYLVSNVHEEAIDFLIASAKHKIWNNVFKDEKKEISKLKSLKETEYAKRVQQEFLSEYNRALNLKIPKGYDFRIEGKFEGPNLMQKLTAAKVVHEKRIGNWSGTGAGKTLSAILASRVINAHNTLICCPNALANNPNQGWSNEILSVYPDSNVQLKSFEVLKTNTNNYYVFNYESFQQPNSGEKIKNFIKKVNIDFIVIDPLAFVIPIPTPGVSVARVKPVPFPMTI